MKKEDLKRIETLEKELKQLKEELNKPKKFEWDYEAGNTHLLCITSTDDGCNGNGSKYLKHGRYRRTEANAQYSLKRNKRANRLEALVEQIQGDLTKGGYSIFKGESKYLCYRSTMPNVESVLMEPSTAVKICEMLNNGEFDLNGDL